MAVNLCVSSHPWDGGALVARWLRVGASGGRVEVECTRGVNEEKWPPPPIQKKKKTCASWPLMAASKLDPLLEPCDHASSSITRTYVRDNSLRKGAFLVDITDLTSSYDHNVWRKDDYNCSFEQVAHAEIDIVPIAMRSVLQLCERRYESVDTANRSCK